MESINELSPKAFYLLSKFQSTSEHSDDKMLEIIDMGVTSYRKYKRELKDKGYLSVKQVGKAEYEYKVKKYVSRS